MIGTLELAMAVSGGFFGTAIALTGAYVIVRVIVVRAITQFVGGAHAADVCPLCKRPMQHDHAGDEDVHVA